MFKAIVLAVGVTASLVIVSCGGGASPSPYGAQTAPPALGTNMPQATPYSDSGY
jgi:hypothetical protein